MLGPPPVVAQDDRFCRVQTLKLAVCARGDRVGIYVFQLPVAVAPPGIERSVVTGFLDCVEHVVVFDDVPAQGPSNMLMPARGIIIGFRPRSEVDAFEALPLAALEQRIANGLRISNERDSVRPRFGNVTAANHNAPVVIVHEDGIAAHLVDEEFFSSTQSRRPSGDHRHVAAQQRFEAAALKIA
jgi:hypothetical protein